MATRSSRSEQDTFQLGQKIGQGLQPPQLILLYGELGSGKTALTRGLAEGLGVTDPDMVRSPSYTLVNEYPGRNTTIYHLDFYRLDGLRDLYSIGLEEILASHAIVIIEWAEKLLLEVENFISIHIQVDLETGTRRFEIGGSAGP
ncbi:MAG: tRNA (adenosine(37)-N6)-threonylcarbamoyltransferase complex ATPase subunit type 1 TsaE [Acidobacteriota bacterium]